MHLWRSPILLFAVTGVLSVPFLTLGVVTGGTLPGLGVSVSIGMVICPALAATALAHREGGGAGVRTLWSRLRHRPRHVPAGPRIRWWTFAIAVLPVVTAVSVGATVLLGGGGELSDLRGALLTAALVAVPLVPLAVLEEIGWTGYATDPLQHRWGMVRASLLMGALWGVWHLIPWLQVHEVSWVLWQVVYTIAQRVVIVGAYNALGGSIWAAVLIHAMSNVCFVAAGTLYDPAPMAVLTGAVALGVVLNRRCRNGPLARDTPQR